MRTPNNYLLLLGCLLTLALLLRGSGWETQDAKQPYLFYEPDEHQHLQIAQLQLQHLQADIWEGKIIKAKPFNAQGFGRQLGSSLWVLPASKETPSHTHIIKRGRILSTSYALLLMLIVFWMGRRLVDPLAGLFAAGLVGINDLNITYSHYAVPEIGYTFWLYAFLAAGTAYLWRPQLLNLALVCFSAAGVFAIKFDFLPAFACLPLAIWPIWHKPYSARLTYLICSIILLVFSFYLHTFGQIDLDSLRYSWEELQTQNQNAVAVDNHWLHNPLLYLLGTLAALGLPSLIAAILGGRRLWYTLQWPIKTHRARALLLIFVLIALEFGVRWSIDTPFVRRLNYLMPALCLLAGLQLAYWWRSARYWLVLLIAIYGLAFTIASQWNHWNDPRYAARDYIRAHYADELVSYSGYVQTIGMPPAQKPLAESNIYVMHETFYRRFGKSFTTPFKTPRCVEEVYHNFWPAAHCEFHQRLLAGTDPVFTFSKGFYTREIFPERWLHHALFGHFETFRGDVLIYRKH